MNIPTEGRYRTLKLKLAAFDRWLGKRRSYRPEEVPYGLTVTNDERSEVEVYEFLNSPPLKYFAYVKSAPKAVLTNWMGYVLGDIVKWGYAHKGNMGDVRVAITVRAINGYMYTGTYYKSAGDYARIKRGKRWS
jgi:hypothetical protein